MMVYWDTDEEETFFWVLQQSSVVVQLYGDVQLPVLASAGNCKQTLALHCAGSQVSFWLASTYH
jgi:hypothetical protein